MLAAAFPILQANWLFGRDLKQDDRRLDAKIDGGSAEFTGDFVDPGNRMPILADRIAKLEGAMSLVREVFVDWSKVPAAEATA